MLIFEKENIKEGQEMSGSDGKTHNPRDQAWWDKLQHLINKQDKNHGGKQKGDGANDLTWKNWNIL